MVVPILKLAVLGSGPSAFYTVSRILSVLPKTEALQNAVRVHMFDRLWAPHGLVRYGVAPDHPEVKNCMHKFHEVACDPRVSFFGNVDVIPAPINPPGYLAQPVETATDAEQNEDSSQRPLDLQGFHNAVMKYGKGASFRILPHGIFAARYNKGLLAGEGRYLAHPNPVHANVVTLDTLFQCYTHLLIASGAPVPNLHPALPPVDRKIVPALDVVYWYTDHPSPRAELMRYDIPQTFPEHVTIIGNGNVALDVARILLSDPARLEPYGLPTHVMNALRRSHVKHVSIVGRRGPREASFTAKELRELMNLEGVAFAGVDPAVLAEAEAEAGAAPLSRQQKRLLDILRKGSALAPGADGVRRTWSLDFWHAPTGATAADGAPLAYDSPGPIVLHLARTRPLPGGGVAATAETTARETGLVVTALGQHASPETTPFCDPRLGHVRTVGGSATHPEAGATTARAAADATAAHTPESAPAAGATATTSPLAAPTAGAGAGQRRAPVYGQVLHPATGTPLPNVFAAGWAARGARGVLGSTMLDAHAVGEALVEDWLECLRAAEAKDAAAAEAAAEAAEAAAAAEDDAARAEDADADAGAETEPERPPTLAEMYGLSAQRRLPLGPRTLVNAVFRQLHAGEQRRYRPVVTYPEFLELQAQEAARSAEEGRPVRIDFSDVCTFARRSDGTQKWFAHMKGEMPYQRAANKMEQAQTGQPEVQASPVEQPAEKRNIWS